jgi:peptide methionine sulfoxide reductase MsrA
MKTLAVLIACIALCGDAYTYSTSNSNSNARGSASVVNVAPVPSRRNILGNAIAAVTALTFGSTSAVAATDDETDVGVYFGVGCFWHIQHEFVDAERKLLDRGDRQLTSRAGYAGGTQTGSEGRVCYHNSQSLADYGKLGHGEVVGMKLPEKSIGDFAKVYFSLFTPKGERVDPGDRGGEYRSLLGLPNGMKHPMYPQVEAAGLEKGFTLEAGKGNDPDTFGKKLIYVYDSNKFPFYQAEVYHQ